MFSSSVHTVFYSTNTYSKLTVYANLMHCIDNCYDFTIILYDNNAERISKRYFSHNQNIKGSTIF